MGKKQSSGQSLKAPYAPKGIIPSQQVYEFPEKQLVVSADKLFFCKFSVIENHIQSSKHISGKQALATEQVRQRDLAQALEKQDTETHSKEETFPGEQKAYRARVVLVFMEAGIPFSKLHCLLLREILEEYCFRLAHSRHMLAHVTFVLHKECSCTRREVSDKMVSIVLDGTTRLGEVLVVVYYYYTLFKTGR